MKKLVIGDLVSRAWDLAVKHWPIFVLLAFVNSCFSGLGVNIDQTLYMEGLQNNDPQALAQAITISPFLAVGVLISIYLGYVIFRILVNAVRTGKPYQTMAEAFKIDLNHFAIYFAAYFCFELALALGFIACIIPGIFLTVRWLFVPLIAATEEVSFADAFGRSWQITKGHFWELFLLGLTAIGIYILGLCACCVGIFFAEVIVWFLIVLAYEQLKDEAPQPAAEATDYVEVK